MSWITYSGRTPSEFDLGIHGGGGISPSLLVPRRTWQDDAKDLVKNLAPEIKDYLAKKHADEVANALMNMQTPPRAEAVDQYGATYDPALARSQGLNSPTEPQSTAPASGGVQWLKAQQMYQAILDKKAADESQSTNDYWANKVREAQVNKLQADADAPDPRTATPSAPIVDPDTGFIWNGREWVRPRATQNQTSGLPPGVSADMYRRSIGNRPYNPRAAFQNNQAAMTSQTTLPAPDLPPVTAPEPTMAPSRDQQAREIRDAYQSGQIGREEARRRLKLLGYD